MLVKMTPNDAVDVKTGEPANVGPTHWLVGEFGEAEENLDEKLILQGVTLEGSLFLGAGYRGNDEFSVSVVFYSETKDSTYSETSVSWVFEGDRFLRSISIPCYWVEDLQPDAGSYLRYNDLVSELVKSITVKVVEEGVHVEVQFYHLEEVLNATIERKEAETVFTYA